MLDSIWKDIKKDHENNYFIPFNRQKTKGLQYHPISEEAIEILDDIVKREKLGVKVSKAEKRAAAIAATISQLSAKSHATSRIANCFDVGKSSVGALINAIHSPAVCFNRFIVSLFG